jgi:dCTP deaminase
MIINGNSLIFMEPIVDMVPLKEHIHGTSYGLGEAGYDIRIKQDVSFLPQGTKGPCVLVNGEMTYGRFALASAIEEFQMPRSLVGIVHDKSTWARKGLSVFNTVIEPGWHGFLTLELVYHGNEPLHIKAGSGIAQVIFSEIKHPTSYSGKYQNQEDRPVPARDSV